MKRDSIPCLRLPVSWYPGTAKPIPVPPGEKLVVVAEVGGQQFPAVYEDGRFRRWNGTEITEPITRWTYRPGRIE